MRIVPDTNVLVRAITGDEPRQSAAARRELAGADSIVVTLPILCELVWVLRRGYRVAVADIAVAVRRLADTETVVLDRPAVEAGLALLEAGADFADGVIAYEGNCDGADCFVSFDRQALSALTARGVAARAPSRAA